MYEIKQCEIALNKHGVITSTSCIEPFPYIVVGTKTVCLIELGQNILQLLNGFYQRHSADMPDRLVIQPGGLDQYKLLNQGSIVGLPSDSGYLEEFVSFTEYLKGVI
jgi:hypothetical protein